MRLLAIALMLSLVGSALAYDLGNEKPTKPPVNAPQNVPGARQGGDTILDAVEIILPVYDLEGTTLGYVNDYDEICPYSGSTSPDVVYTFTPQMDENLDVDMFGSTYDTKIYVYDEDLFLVACNDDYYSDYVSKIENMPVIGGVRYYLVIDGYGGDAGDYVLTIGDPIQCFLECPAGAQLEGEPPLVDGYADAWNGGCNSPEFGNPFQPITDWVFCGRSGWYVNTDGGQSRDTDWFELVIPVTGMWRIEGDAEYASYMFELGPQDCGSVGVLQNVDIGPCLPADLTIVGEPSSSAWFWVGPQTFDGVGEFTYVLFFDDGGFSAVENHSWTEVKGLFD